MLHGVDIDAVALEVLHVVEVIDFSRLARLELTNIDTGIEQLIGVLTTIFGGRLKSLMLEMGSYLTCKSSCHIYIAVE